MTNLFVQELIDELTDEIGKFISEFQADESKKPADESKKPVEENEEVKKKTIFSSLYDYYKCNMQNQEDDAKIDKAINYVLQNMLPKENGGLIEVILLDSNFFECEMALADEIADIFNKNYTESILEKIKDLTDFDRVEYYGKTLFFYKKL